MVARRQFFLAAVLLCLIPSLGQSSEMTEAADFTVVQAKAVELGKQHGPENVLLVFDLDNTLLTANQSLGSDQWYNWQAGLLERSPQSPQLVAKDIQGLLRVQGILFALGHMHPPKKNQPRIVENLQARGLPTLVLTARGPDFRDATMRHLAEGGYSFAASAPKTADAFRGTFLPYRLADTAASGISAKEAERFRLEVPREVSYDHGVFMVAGQNKGAMLLILLAHCPRRFSAVIFVDDQERNTKDVFSALVQRGVEAATFRYSAEDEAVKAFSKQQKRRADANWKKLDKTIDRVFERPFSPPVPLAWLVAKHRSINNCQPCGTRA